MTTEEIKELIDNNEDAQHLAKVGDDIGLAKLLSEIAPSVRRVFNITKRQLHQSFGFLRGVELLETLRTVGASAEPSAAIFREVISLLESSDGLDISHPDATILLDQWVAANIVTKEERDTLLALGKVQPVITADEVSAALAADRPDGKVEA